MNLSIWTLVSILCFIPAVIVHECAHGFVAHKLGDPTAKRMGRLSLNPLKHIDPFGTVLLPLVLAALGLPVFGYAKPVPYNPTYFKNIRIGELLTGLAGPIANFLMALVGALVGLIMTSIVNASNYEVVWWIYSISFYFSLINLYLMFFNLLPIPPLDGSSIIAIFLSDRALAKYYSIQQYSLPILMIVLIIIPMLINVNPISWYLNNTAGSIAYMLFGM